MLMLPFHSSASVPPEASYFFAIWTTSPESLAPRHVRAIESVCRWHPRATVDVLSNSLSGGFFALQRRAGCNINVKPYDLRALVSGSPAQVWYSFRRFWNRSSFFPNHEADLLRLLILHKRGGVYVDTDVVFTRPFHFDGCTGVVGIEDGRGGQPAPHMAAESRSLTPTQGDLVPRSVAEQLPPNAVLCNAVMGFAAGATAIRSAVDTFVREYVPLTPGLSMLELHARGEWGAMGPMLLTRIARRNLASNGQLCILERAAFYPISPADMSKYLGAWDEARDPYVWERLQARSVAVHYWNALTKHLPLVCGSLMHRLLETNCMRGSETATCVSKLPCESF